MTAWWARLPPTELPLDCAGQRHRLRWESGTLHALDHADPDGERTLTALGGDTSRCIQILDAWVRHTDDLTVPLLASRGLRDPLPARAEPGPTGRGPSGHGAADGRLVLVLADDPAGAPDARRGGRRRTRHADRARRRAPQASGRRGDRHLGGPASGRRATGDRRPACPARRTVRTRARRDAGLARGSRHGARVHPAAGRRRPQREPRRYDGAAATVTGLAHRRLGPPARPSWPAGSASPPTAPWSAPGY